MESVKMAYDTRQIIVYGTNYSQESFYPVTSKGAYECANAAITRGVTGIPNSLDDCFLKFPYIKDIATAIGFFTEGNSGPSGVCGSSNEGACGACGGSGSSGGYSLWEGPQGTPPTMEEIKNFKPLSMYFDNVSEECLKVESDELLGQAFLGCLWGTPSASYSCVCPQIGNLYPAYVRLRLNDASFWDTPPETPVKRKEFIDSIQYSTKVDITVAGDFNLKVGQVVNIRIGGTGLVPTGTSYLDGAYYIIGLKHSITNSGSHETVLSLSKILKIGSSVVKEESGESDSSTTE